MKHIFFLVHIFAFAIGFISITLSLLLYKRNKTVIAKVYSLFILSLTLVLFEQTIMTYIKVNKIDISYLAAFLKILSSVGCAMTIYYSPAFSHEFLGIAMSRRLRTGNRILACIPLLNNALYYVLPWPSAIISISNIALFVSVFYTVFLPLHHLKDLSMHKRKIVKAFIVLSIIALPFLFLDIIIERIPGIGSDFPYGILSLPLYYAVWNIFSIYFGLREYGYLMDSKNLPQEKNNLIEKSTIDIFCGKYNITSREKEVIQLLVKGYSYNKISEELMVSLSTTKSHIYNIYQKSGVKNKIQLLYLIKNSIED